MKARLPLHQPGFGAVAWAGMVLIYAPVVVLVVFALNRGQLFHLWEGVSLRWFEKALANPGFRRAAWNTMVVSVSATLIATALATAAALALERARAREAGLALLVLGLPLVVPEVVMAIATMIFFSQVPLPDIGIGRLILGHTAFCIPFALMPVRACLQGIDPRLGQAARDLHASDGAVLCHVTLPLLVPGIVSGAALAFIVSFDDFAMAQFVAGPGQTTLPVFIWAQLRRPLTPEINAMCAIVLIVSTLLICLATALTARRGQGFSR